MLTLACFQSASSYRRAGSGRITGSSMVSNAVRRRPGRVRDAPAVDRLAPHPEVRARPKHRDRAVEAVEVVPPEPRELALAEARERCDQHTVLVDLGVGDAFDTVNFAISVENF
ncbi:hypothetical protein [Sorangium sp. So ce341]|uniref:hypothetical protein n=1 Tax=Sorangium sp. So ce341 TaxID=3133302 RepID=UPI003F5EA418